jgi:hypothetical protein
MQQITLTKIAILLLSFLQMDLILFQWKVFIMTGRMALAAKYSQSHESYQLKCSTYKV